MAAVKSAVIHISTPVLGREIGTMISGKTIRMQFPMKSETGVCAGIEAGDFRGFQDLLY